MITAFIVNPNTLLIAIAFALMVLLFAFRAKVKELVNVQLTRVRHRENKLYEVANAISGEIQLIPLLHKIMETVSDILDADRTTLFLYDDKTDELWSQVAEGVNQKEIRFLSHLGIAGSCFTNGQTINIKDAYQDDRFNRAVDKKTGYRTRSILCIQVCNKSGTPIGVVQALNKRQGPFLDIDEMRLRAFTAQASIAIENAQLFAEMVNIKNYNEALLEAMRAGIISTDTKQKIIKVNRAAQVLLGTGVENLINKSIDEVFYNQNSWIGHSVQKSIESGFHDEAMDTILHTFVGEQISINLTVQPLENVEKQKTGCLLIIEDITQEKRLRSTMARYLTKEVADKLLNEGEQALGGSMHKTTILFCDIRAFTRFSERNSPQETVQMLNEYFGIMFEQITSNNGIIDKYIGDAIMAVFGAPFRSPRDADNAVQASISMMDALREFNLAREKAGKEKINAGIGLNTGEVLSGNIGSQKRMDYTVIGDDVNIAARMESATKTYKTPILLTGHTVSALSENKHRLREIDQIRVRGRTKPVTIFEVIDGLLPEQANLLADNLELHQQALNDYRQQNWEEAKRKFQEILSICPTDNVSKLFSDRCDVLRKSPPANNWDGVWVMVTK